jgi:HK97 family phage portal protein
MKFWDRITGRKAADASDGLMDILARILNQSKKSKSGAIVSIDTALQVGAVFACVRVIAEGVAQVPFRVMRETSSSVSVHSQRLSAADHPLYDLLHRRPNDWQTSFEFRETMVMHLALTGSAFAFINRVRGQVAELILLDPGRVTVKQNADWSLTYKVSSKTGDSKEFPAASIWHLRGPSWNGVVGLDVLRLAREAIGLSLATEETHASLHESGVRPSGIYSVDGTLNPEQYKNLKKWIDDNNAGAENAGSVMLLDRNAKFVPLAVNGVDAQHLETRRYQVEEVCRFLRVMPIMAGYSDKAATYASAEQMFLAHVIHTLMPWYERLQQSAEVNLLTKQERASGYYIKLQEAGLLRGALKDTSEYLYRLTMGGIMERNEARAKLDLNPLAGLDQPLTPMNLTTDPNGAGDQTNKPEGNNA